MHPLIFGLVWGLIIGTELVALWEFDDLVLRVRGSALRAGYLVLVWAGALGVDQAVLHAVVPLAIYAVTWWAVWWRVDQPAVRGGAAVALAGTWLWSIARQPDPAVHIGVGLAAAVGAGILAAGGRPAWRRVPQAPVGIPLALVAVIGGVLWAVHPDAVRDIAAGATGALVVGSYVLLQDQRRRYWAAESYRADHDALTGLLTRHGLARWRAQHPGATGLVVALDLDDFKAINDTFGHAAGDAILREVAQRLQAAVRGEDAVVRLGGDELAVWLPGIHEPEARHRVEALRATVADTPYPLGSDTVALGASVGWACGVLGPETAEQADRHLLQAKRSGKNRVWPPPDAPLPSRPARPPNTTLRLGWLADAARQLWAHWPEAAVLTDPEGRVVAVHPAFERLTGLTADTVQGRLSEALRAEEAPTPVTEALWATIRAGVSWTGYLHNRWPGGPDWWARETVVPIQVGGRLVGFWAHVRADLPAAAWRGSRGVPLGWTASDVVWDVVFQPIVRLADAAVLGWEALGRPRVHGAPLSPGVLFAAVAGTADEVLCDRSALAATAEAIARHGGPAALAGRTLFVNIRAATLLDARFPDGHRPGAVAGKSAIGLVLEAGAPRHPGSGAGDQQLDD